MKKKQATEEKSEIQFIQAVLSADKASVKMKVANLALRSFADDVSWGGDLPVTKQRELDAIVKMLGRQQKKLESSLREATDY